MTLTLDDNAFARADDKRRRPGFTIAPTAIAWDAVAFEVRGERTAIVCAPRDVLDEFIEKLDDGALDAEINAFLSTPPSGRSLRAAGQTRRPGLFDELESRASIAPAERVPSWEDWDITAKSATPPSQDLVDRLDHVEADCIPGA